LSGAEEIQNRWRRTNGGHDLIHTKQRIAERLKTLTDEKPSRKEDRLEILRLA